LLNKMEVGMSHYEDNEPMAIELVEVTVGQALNVGSGNISAGEMTPEREERIGEGVRNNIVAVNPDAPGCCIDGRGCRECMNGQKSEARAKVAGGPLITAYVAAEVTGWFGDSEDSAEEKLERLAALLEANGVHVGGHVDINAASKEFIDPVTNKPRTGCGANDRLPEILQVMHDDPETISALTDALLGEQQPVQEGPVPKEEVVARNGKWNPKNVVNLLGNNDGGSVEILVDNHREAAVVANYIEDTTVDRDGVIEDIDEQVFTVDMWYIDKIARAMTAGNPDGVQQFSELRRAMTGYQVGTYMTLCDGSQLLLTAK
jgi:hypothetical protein